jgi:hypothetical protein
MLSLSIFFFELSLRNANILCSIDIRRGIWRTTEDPAFYMRVILYAHESGIGGGRDMTRE